MFLFLPRHIFLCTISDRLSLHIHVYEIINISLVSFSLFFSLYCSLSLPLFLASSCTSPYRYIYVYFFISFSVIVLGIRLLGINAFLSFSRVACITAPQQVTSTRHGNENSETETICAYAWFRLIDVESISNVRYEMYGEMRKQAFSVWFSKCIFTCICNFFERRASSSPLLSFSVLIVLQRAKGNTLCKMKRRS